MSSGAALVVEADGGSRGNPGVAGYGALVRDARSGAVLAERAAPLGRASNNVAEYTGLLEGLRAVLDLGLAEGATVEVRMDSKLVVEQMSGRWKIKHEDMRRLALDARRLVNDIQAAGGSVTFTWVPRESNKAADALSNDGMDGRTVRRDHVGASGTTQRSGPAPEGPSGGAGQQGSLLPHASQPAEEDLLPVGPPTFGDSRAPVADLMVSDETVPTLEGQVRLVLVRHGVTDFTASHRIDGRGGSNPPLNREGLLQAEAAAGAVRLLLERSGVDRVTVVSSSLRRAQQTGDSIAAALGTSREEDADWDEQAFGDWDGRTMARLVGQYGEELLRLRQDADYARPGGESRRQLDARVGAALGRAIARGGTVVVATHRVVIMSVLARFLGIDHERAWSVATGPASLTAVEIWPDGVASLQFVNDTHHLHHLARHP